MAVPHNPRPAVVGALGLAIGLTLMANLLIGLGGNPVVLMHFGREYPLDARVEGFARQEFGDNLVLVPYSGHDGKFFYMQARDPFLLHPEQFATYLDRPGYRAQRLGYPLMASPGNVFGPMGVVIALLTLNVVAYGFGTWVTAGLARAMGASAWWGMAFPLCVGFAFEMLITGSQIWAAAFAIAGLWAILERRLALGVAALAAAALCRETALLWAFGAAAYLWRQDRKSDAAWVAGAPLAVTLVWAAYVFARLDSPPWAGGDGGLSLPLVGFFEAMKEWWATSAPEIWVGPAMLLLVGVIFWQAWKRPSLLSWAAAGWALLVLILGPAVWKRASDFTRIAAILMVAFPISVGVGMARRQSAPALDEVSV